MHYTGLGNLRFWHDLEIVGYSTDCKGSERLALGDLSLIYMLHSSMVRTHLVDATVHIVLSSGTAVINLAVLTIRQQIMIDPALQLGSYLRLDLWADRYSYQRAALIVHRRRIDAAVEHAVGAGELYSLQFDPIRRPWIGWFHLKLIEIVGLHFLSAGLMHAALLLSTHGSTLRRAHHRWALLVRALTRHHKHTRRILIIPRVILVQCSLDILARLLLIHPSLRRHNLQNFESFRFSAIGVYPI